MVNSSRMVAEILGVKARRAVVSDASGSTVMDQKWVFPLLDPQPMEGLFPVKATNYTSDSMPLYRPTFIHISGIHPVRG